MILDSAFADLTMLAEEMVREWVNYLVYKGGGREGMRRNSK